MLEYSEYKNLIDTLEQTDHENTYQGLMQKESKVLDTVNQAIKVYKDDKVKRTQFVNTPISDIVHRFFTVWNEIIQDLVSKGNSLTDVYTILNSKDRLVYVGVTLVILSVIFYYVEISRE